MRGSRGDPAGGPKPTRRGAARTAAIGGLLIWAAIAGLLGAAEVVPVSPEPAIETVTAEVIKTRRAQAEQATDLDEATKQKLLQTYDEAQGMLDAAAKSVARVAELQAKIDSAPEQLRQTKESLKALPPAPPAASADGKELQELKQILAEKETELSKKKEAAEALKAELARRMTARKDLASSISAAQEKLTATDKELLALASSTAPPAAVLAQRTLLLAQRQALRQSISAQEKELAMYDATASLLPIQQELAVAEAALAQKEHDQWRALVDRQTALEAARQAEQARREALEADPALKGLTAENKELTEKAEEAARLIQTLSEKQEVINKTLDDVKQQFQGMEERVKAVGLTNANGLLMRTRRAQLPDVGQHYGEIRARQKQIRDVQTTSFELQDRQSAMGTFEQQVESALAEIRPQATHLPEVEFEAAVRDLVTKQREYLTTAQENYRECFKKLIDLDEAQQKLVRQIEQFAAYIDEYVLWIRSAEPLSLDDVHYAGWVVKRMLNPKGPKGWIEIGEALKTDTLIRPLLLFLAVCVFGPWLYGQGRLRAWVTRTGEQAAASTQQRILPTLNALGLTFLIAAIWPALLCYLAWRLWSPLEATDFAKAVAAGLLYAAGWLFSWEFLRQLCRPQGPAEAHFDWPTGSLRVLRRHLRWFVPAGLLLSFVIGLVAAQGVEKYQASLGRLAFIAFLLLQAVFVQLVLRPTGGLFRHLLAAGLGGWFYRFRHVWYTLGLVAPLSLAVLAVLGYFYTAYQLAARFRETVYLALAVVVLGAIVARWVLMLRRKLAIQRIRARRAAAEAADASAAGTAAIPAAPPTADQEPDLTAVSKQTRRLLNSLLVLATVVGLWWIWVDVLPALAFLDRVELWSTTVTATESVTTGEGPPTPRTVERPEPVTLADLGLAILVFLMTAVAARNIPGLLEISMPQRLPLDAGARYAITKMTRYGVTVIGVILGFGVLGIGWSKVQWLVAALTVGLGFGLQEIFANFISGLILLFERPIRVGDVVTVGDVTGVVTRIQARATIVTNWDRQDFIVPNKEFITGRLLNWTLSSAINRVVISVGVAYGSDTELARQLLLKILTEHPEVMDDPGPLVTFEGFGDSSLDFVVRCYLPNLDKRLATIHELHTAIDQAFREAGIEIAFPQRDIHLRSGGALLKEGDQRQKDSQPESSPRTGDAR